MSINDLLSFTLRSVYIAISLGSTLTSQIPFKNCSVKMAISLRQLIAPAQMIAFKWCKTNVALLKWFCATLFQCGHLLFTWKTHCSLKFHFGENKDSENKIKKIKILKNQQKYFCRFFQKSKTDWTDEMVIKIPILSPFFVHGLERLTEVSKCPLPTLRKWDKFYDLHH